MTTPFSPDSPYHPLTKEGPDNTPQLSRSKLGKERYGGSSVSYSIAEHPTAFRFLIGTVLTIALLICAIVYYSVYSPSENGVGVCIFLLVFSIIIAIGFIIAIFCKTVTSDILKTPDDALFFLKLIATGHSWDEVGRIMNSYLFERGIWWTNSYFYDSEQCYDLFVIYSKGCADPAIEPFIEQAKSKLAESLAQRWEGIGLSGV
ncbi:protein PRM8 [Kluyveromyces marxianus]|uniref:Protein PRM8 n=1 Tax=Kluyveromyces marxianus TaxID=4911 RepID=A0ABX6EQM1_KLUMA|nr:protein PRM8 [Kluyveromyces marxianus]